MDLVQNEPVTLKTAIYKDKKTNPRRGSREIRVGDSLGVAG